MNRTIPHVAVIDEDEESAAALAMLLEDAGARVVCSATENEAAQPSADGAVSHWIVTTPETAKRIARRGCAVLLLSASLKRERAEALGVGVAVLQKPASPGAILAWMRAVAHEDPHPTALPA